MTELSPYRENALGNSGSWTEERLRKIPMYKRQIIEGIASGLFMSEIVEELAFTLKVVRKWRMEDKEFDTDISDAEARVTDSLEKEAIRRAKNGVLEPLVAGGKLVTGPDGEIMQIRRYSDGLMQFLLKGRRREVYGDKQEIDAKVGIDVVGAKSSLEAKFAAATIINLTPNKEPSQ